jgi:biofilm PGA synthesis lipoprotein PgaB
MLRFIIAIITSLVLAMWAPRGFAAEPATPSFIALAYHSVEDVDPDQSFMGVSTDRLVAQLSWLQGNGYTAISIDDLLAARDGRRALPDKAVLLTFDDGYESFYTRVLPILKAFRFPAVLAIVGVWLEGGPDATVSHNMDMAGPDPQGTASQGSALKGPASKGNVQFGDQQVKRNVFLTWDQIREIAASGLVEIASHTYDAHHGTNANPQGNSQPAVTTRSFDPVTRSYESDASERRTLEADSAKMVAKIKSETGKRPRVMVWPYGEHNNLAISIAAANGMLITLTLTDGAATLDRLSAVPRHLITPDPALNEYVAELRTVTDIAPIRVVQIDLDEVYDPDAAQQERNVGQLVQRIFDMQINTVFLQAFADPDGTGLARQVYFPNRLLPVRADLFNRVSWQLRTRTHVRVFAWMPVLAFDFGDTVATVLAWNPKSGTAEPDPKAYRRVSPFDAAARDKVLMMYEDLARSAPFEGLLFHDDATLSDFEDASPPALAAYARAGLPASIEAIRADPETMRRWTRLKTDALLAFTAELAARAMIYRTPLLTARNMYALPVLDGRSEEWFAQDLDRFLRAYDYTAIMAMPAMENVPTHDAEVWLRRLVAAVAARPLGLRRTIFELQAVDWRHTTAGNDNNVPAATLVRQMRLLLRMGALNFGYYPDDFIAGLPDQRTLHPAFSLQSYPYLK